MARPSLRLGLARGVEQGGDDVEPSIAATQFGAGSGKHCQILLDRSGDDDGLHDRELTELVLGVDGLLDLEAERDRGDVRSEEHTSELQSLMRSSYAVFCLTKKKQTKKKYKQT